MGERHAAPYPTKRPRHHIRQARRLPEGRLPSVPAQRLAARLPGYGRNHRRLHRSEVIRRRTEEEVGGAIASEGMASVAHIMTLPRILPHVEELHIQIIRLF